MNTAVEKIYSIKYGSAIRKTIIFGLVFGIIGAAVTALTMKSRLASLWTAVQAGGHENEIDELMHSSVYAPGIATYIIGGITLLAVICAAVIYWLLVASWLYKEASESDMDPVIWFILGLVGNFLAAIAFSVVRGKTRKKCAECGTWGRKTAFCSNCGHEMTIKCPNCDSKLDNGANYCPSCGNEIMDK